MAHGESTACGDVRRQSPSRIYQAKDGSTRTYQTHLLRRSFRDGGKVKKETLANLSALPDSAIAALKASLSGSVLVDAGDMFEIERFLPHRHVAAAHVMASRLGLGNLLGPDCPERDLAYGLIIARAVAPASKLATTRWWADTTLGADLGIEPPPTRFMRRWTGCFPGRTRSKRSWRPGTLPAATWHARVIGKVGALGITSFQDRRG